MLVVPLQIALIPLLRDFNTLNINGTFLAIMAGAYGVWAAAGDLFVLQLHVGACRARRWNRRLLMGRPHFTVFMRLVMPLSMPALASFCIFQFIVGVERLSGCADFLGRSEQGCDDATGGDCWLARG